ncbi:hypothetical protein [Tropicimonas marinistellae]|uniref:hypothetical protein n=1 Tax=Tropicimonas marinistellae TaxID=1739787 RepID=UPI000830E27C|nr:hypothetical protein [Tropicimonas marinistellae]
MIVRAALIACVVLALVAGGLGFLWQAEKGQRALVDRDREALQRRADQAALARDVAKAHARRMERELADHRAALAALSHEDIPDAALDPAVIAILCSVQPTDRVCRD